MNDTTQQPIGDTEEADDVSTSDANGDALDAIVGELRVLLATQHTVEHAEARSASVAKCLETLLALIAWCNNDESRDDADDNAEDIADVLVMVLSVCAQNAWRTTSAKEDSDPIGALLFQVDTMEHVSDNSLSWKLMWYSRSLFSYGVRMCMFAALPVPCRACIFH